MHAHAIAILLLLATPAGVFAQDMYPAAPVRWIIPFAPGGFSDILARRLGPQLSEGWKQTVILDNRPGAGGTVAAEFTLRSPADGSVFLAGTISSHAINFAIRPKLPYHPLKDFSPVTMLAKQPSLLVVHPSLPARNFKEFAALGKQRPGELSYGSPGIGTSMHMTGELVRQMSGANFSHVPYKGGGAALVDVISGHVPAAIIGFAVVAPHVKQGRLRALAVTSATRSAALPEVATFDEQGLNGLEVTSWHALYVKAGTPPAIIDRLHRSFSRVLARRDNIEFFSKEGSDLVASSPQELTAFTESEIARWTRVARAGGIVAE